MSHFRISTEEDSAAIVAMMQGYYAEDGYEFNEGRALDAIGVLVGDPSVGRLWVAVVDERVVGYLAVTLGFSLEYRGRDAFIDELFIVEPHRGRGLGREAMQVAADYCRSKGVHALHLEVEQHRAAARALYPSDGFEEHDRHLMTKLLQ